MSAPDMKLRTARTLKWNLIDKVSSQILYAVTGIILARLLSHEDFGLVGAILIFQAFATLFIEGGFSYALLQRKSPTRNDYSTVLWFNMIISIVLYIILWFSAPIIAQWFDNDTRLIPLSRVMFISLILNASAIVQTNRLMKKMDVKMIAISNSIGLIVSATIGITLAFDGYGAWAIVWQTLSLAATKSIILWATGKWLPLLIFSWSSLRSFFNVGSGMLFSSFCFILFQNIYSFFIGNKVGLVSLGYYTQADKWSKMGIASISQILTSSFLPVLSQFQDDPERFSRTTGKINRFTAYLLFPAIGFLLIMATPIFHLLFGTKWDASIPLFQILLIRGIFTVMGALHNNTILSLGKARMIVYLEIFRDAIAIIAIFITLPYMVISYDYDIVYGMKILLWGQLITSAMGCIATMFYAAKYANVKLVKYIGEWIPYILLTCVIILPMYIVTHYLSTPVIIIMLQLIIGAGLYLLFNHIFHSKIQKDAFDYILYRFRKK